MGLALPAYAQEARPVRIAVPRTVAPPMDFGLPAELGRLPKTAPLALYTPQLRILMQDLGAATYLLGSVLPNAKGLSAPELLANLVWGQGLGFGWSAPTAQPELAPLSTPQGHAAIGINSRAPVTALVHPELRVALISFGLTDRPKWERWLDNVSPDRKPLEIGAEHASVLTPQSDMPVTCLARHRRAFCQFGAMPGANPFAMLTAATQGDTQTWADEPGLADAHGALPPNARAYAVVDSVAVGHWLSKLAIAQAQRTYRLSPKKIRRAALKRVRTLGLNVQNFAAKINGTALGLYRDRQGLSARMESTLSEAAAQQLRPHLRNPGEHDLVSEWAQTPALMQAILRANPKTAKQILSTLKVNLPLEALSGDVALLTLGLDSECPMAKASRKARHSAGFLVPSAAAIGIAKDYVKEGDIPSQLQGSPYEVDIQERIVLVGAGQGTRAAARRRLNTLPQHKSRTQPPMLEVSIDLHAIDSAFDSSSVGVEHRRELRTLDALRLGLQPLLEHVSDLKLAASAKDNGRRVSIKLRAQR